MVKISRKRSPILQKLMIVAAVCLYLFIAFVIGLGASQLDYFQDDIEMVKLALKDAPYEKKFPTEYSESLHTWTDDPAQVHDKLLLTSAAYRTNPAIMLVDRDGKIVHQWNLDSIYSNPEVVKWHEIQDPSNGGTSSIDDGILFPNGDLIVIQDNRMLNNYRGQRMVRLDKDSKILWQITGEFHHEIDLGEDGNIYAMDYELRDHYPVIDKHTKEKVKFLADTIMKISQDGKVLQTISVPDAFVGTPYEFYLYSFDLDVPTVQEFEFPHEETHAFDPEHTNCVQYLTRRLAAQLPFAQPGDLLISMRGPSAIAVLRPSTGKIVWAAKGPWRHQHNVRLLPNGLVRMFDNDGVSMFIDDEDGEIEKVNKSRILDYNPNNGQVSVRYFDPDYYDTWTFWRGAHYEQEDGSMFFLSTEASRVLQLSPEGKVVWEMRGIADRESPGVAYRQRISIAKPYDRNYLKFLNDTDTSASKEQ